MSRWIAVFDAHPFQDTWLSLKKALDEVVIDDVTVITSVQEVARLRKVACYLDGIISGIDPELIPPATWDSFNSQADGCARQIEAYNGNKNINHINSANDHADNLLTYVRPYMIAEGDVSKLLQDSIRSYAKTVDEYADSFVTKSSELISQIENQRNRGDQLFENINNVSKSIDEYNAELFGGSEDVSGLKQRIDGFFNELTEKYNGINKFYNELLIGNQDNVSTRQLVLTAKTAIEEDQVEIENFIKTTDSAVKDLLKFHLLVFGENDDGFSRELDELMASMDAFEKKQKLKYEALNQQIEELLPGATSAGLASAYNEMKGTFDAPIKSASKLFYGSVAALVGLSLFVASGFLALDEVSSAGGDSWSFVFMGLVGKLPYYVPIVWLAFYATRRRSECQRLQQEYAHKESLAKSYNSYKRQIDKLDDKDNVMQKELIMKAVDAIAFNPSETLDGKHGDKTPAYDFVEKAMKKVMKEKGGD
jgi:hypothetical protein